MLKHSSILEASRVSICDTCKRVVELRIVNAYFMCRRSSSLNLTCHISICSLSSNLTGCWRKKRVTRFKLSLASIMKAKPPIVSCSACSLPCLSLVAEVFCAEPLDLSAIPNRGVFTGASAAHREPSQGSRQCTSSLVKLLFQLSQDQCELKTVGLNVCRSPSRDTAEPVHEKDGPEHTTSLLGLTPAFRSAQEFHPPHQELVPTAAFRIFTVFHAKL